MQVTRAHHVRRWRQTQITQVTVEVSDLPAEEQRPQLAPLWPMLLELAAEKQLVLSLFRQGLLHRNPKKNQALAEVALAKIDTVHKGIVSS